MTITRLQWTSSIFLRMTSKLCGKKSLKIYILFRFFSFLFEVLLTSDVYLISQTGFQLTRTERMKSLLVAAISTEGSLVIIGNSWRALTSVWLRVELAHLTLGLCLALHETKVINGKISTYPVTQIQFDPRKVTKIISCRARRRKRSTMVSHGQVCLSSAEDVYRKVKLKRCE